MAAGLPQTHGGAGRVGDPRHPAGLRHVEWLHHRPSAGGENLRGRGVRVIHRDVGVPHRRHMVLDHLRTLRRHGGDRLAVDQCHRIDAPARVRHVVEAPAEQLGVEGLGGVDVSRLEVHPAGGALGVGAALAHLVPFAGRIAGSPVALPAQAIGPTVGSGDFEGCAGMGRRSA